MKKIFKISSLLMTIVLISSFIGCSVGNDESTEAITSKNAETADSIAETYDATVDANGYKKDSLPEGLNLDTKVAVLYWSDVDRPEFFIENLSEDRITDAVYRRNAATESRLGIKLEWLGTPEITTIRQNMFQE